MFSPVLFFSLLCRLNMARQELGGRAFQGIPHWVPGAPQQAPPENDPAGQLFDQFCAANTFQTIMAIFQQLCDLLELKPSDHRNFYKQLKSRLTSWKAQSLWSKLDKRAAHREYRKGQVCANTRVSTAASVTKRYGFLQQMICRPRGCISDVSLSVKSNPENGHHRFCNFGFLRAPEREKVAFRHTQHSKEHEC